MADSYHQKMLDCCFDYAETKSLEKRNPSLVADWKLTNDQKKYAAQLEKETLQQTNEEKFLELVKWDTENARSTNDSIKRQIDYGNGIKQSRRVTLAGIIRSLEVAIKGRTKRIAELESYLFGERLPPQNLEKARSLVNGVKEINQKHQSEKRGYENELRNSR
ncbi:MAG: hypothetical protein ACK5NT_11360 [Pyrinomonadaceae bacterium]